MFTCPQRVKELSSIDRVPTSPTVLSVAIVVQHQSAQCNAIYALMCDAAVNCTELCHLGFLIIIIAILLLIV